MPASFVNATSAASAGNVASLSAAWPSTTANDWICLLVAIGSTTPALVDPSGFTAVRNQDAGTVLRTKLWAHKCTGSESGSITASWTGGSTGAALTALAYRNLDTTSGLDITGSTSSTTAATSRATAGLTPNRNDSQLTTWCDSQTTATQTWPTLAAGMTQRALAASTVTPFVSILAADLLSPLGIGSGNLPARTSVSGTSSPAYAGYNAGLLPRVDSTHDPFDPLGWQATDITVFGFPTPPDGQLWPRGVSNG
jgi:hypothetical protein